MAEKTVPDFDEFVKTRGDSPSSGSGGGAVPSFDEFVAGKSASSTPQADSYLKDHGVTRADISGPVMTSTPFVGPGSAMKSILPSAVGYATGEAGHLIGLPDWANTGLALASGMLTHGAGKVVTDPEVQDAAMAFNPYKKALNLGTAVLNQFRGTPEQRAAQSMPSMGPRETVSLPSGRQAPVLPFEGRVAPPPPSGTYNPFAEALDPPQLASGRQPGGIRNMQVPQESPLPMRESPLWQQYGAQPHGSPVPEFSPVSSELPSGRYPISSFPLPRENAPRVPGWQRMPITGEPLPGRDLSPVYPSSPVLESGRVIGPRPSLTTEPNRGTVVNGPSQSTAKLVISQPDLDTLNQQLRDSLKARGVPVPDTPSTVRTRAVDSRAKFDANGKRNQLKSK